MQQDYYHEYYIYEREHWWFRARADILSSKLRSCVASEKGRLRILNVGAALGATTEWLAQFGDVVSVEYDRGCCQFLALRRPSDPIINSSVTSLPFQAESFDVVCAFDVIEHVDDDEGAVGELRRVCRPGGAVIVTVPALMALWSHHDTVNQHYRRYRLAHLRNLFRGKGRIVDATYFNTFLFPVVLLVRAGTRLVPQRWIRSGAGSDFSLVRSGLIDRICYRILKSESVWLRQGRVFPFGVSAYLAWKKDVEAPVQTSR